MKIAIPKIKPISRRARYLARRRAQRRARYLARRRLAARIRARQRALARQRAQQRRYRNNRYNQNRSQEIQINLLLRNILKRLRLNSGIMKRYNFFINENFQFPMTGTHSVNHPDSGKILVQFPGNSILKIL